MINFRKVEPPRWGEVTAIFGGRFDPPHLGHREAVRGLFQFPGVKEVLIIPSGTPPHKPTLVNANSRAEMTRLNFMSLPGDSFPSEVRVDTREIVRSQQNSPTYSPTYSYDTLVELQRDFSQLAFVIGADQLASLHTWHRFPELLGLCHWIVLERKPDGSPLARQTLKEWTGSGLVLPFQHSTWKISNSFQYLTLVPTHAPSISSTVIRESISRSGTLGEGLLSPNVLAYLKDHRLYGI